MNKLTFTEIEAALESALAAGQKGNEAIGENCALWTICYTGVHGTGVEVRATVKFPGLDLVFSRQHGPETYRAVAAPSFEVLKARLLGKAQSNYDAAIAAGVTINGVLLAARESDRSAFNQLLTLLREAEELQPTDEARSAFRATLHTIADKAGAPRAMSVNDIRTMIVQYGLQINLLWAALVELKAAIGAATTLDQLTAI